MSAPAPSLVCELLPAVTLPKPVGLPAGSSRAANTGLSLASPSSEVSARGPSSMATVRVFTFTPPLARSGLRSVTVTGVISSANSPLAMALSARWCDS